MVTEVPELLFGTFGTEQDWRKREEMTAKLCVVVIGKERIVPLFPQRCAEQAALPSVRPHKTRDSADYSEFRDRG